MKTLLSRLKTLWCDLKCYVDSFEPTTRENSPILECILDVNLSGINTYTWNVIKNEIGPFSLVSLNVYEFRVQFDDLEGTKFISNITCFSRGSENQFTRIIPVETVGESGYITYRGVTYNMALGYYTPAAWDRVIIKISTKGNG